MATGGTATSIALWAGYLATISFRADAPRRWPLTSSVRKQQNLPYLETVGISSVYQKSQVGYSGRHASTRHSARMTDPFVVRINRNFAWIITGVTLER